MWEHGWERYDADRRDGMRSERGQKSGYRVQGRPASRDEMDDRPDSAGAGVEWQ